MKLLLLPTPPAMFPQLAHIKSYNQLFFFTRKGVKFTSNTYLSHNSQSSISVGSSSTDFTKLRSKIFGGWEGWECYIVADVYYAVRPTMVLVLNMYRLFPCHYSLNDTTTYIAFTLYSVL